jgi:hypothetical protein
MFRYAVAGVLAVGSLLVTNAGAEGATRVRGSIRSSGKYVMPYYRSKSDGRSFNNYGTRGNVNPFTGKSGSRSPSYLRK